jgi:hypothetical protein
MQNQNESNNKPLLYTIIAILVVIIAVPKPQLKKL